MRIANITGALVIGVVLLSASSASAQMVPDSEEDSAEKEKAEKEQKEKVGGAIQSDDSGRNVGVAKQNQASLQKSWSVGGVVETHRLIRQDDLQGNGRSKALNYLFLFAGYGITKYDRVMVRTGVFQRFIADEGESGVRMDDVEPIYTRIIPLPWQITWRESLGVILPVSYESQRNDMIVTPRLITQLDRRFGTFNLTFKNSNAAWFHKFKTNAGGDALPYASFSWSLTGEYAMPFHESLSVGAIAYTGLTLTHDPENGNDPNVQRFGAVTDPNFGNRQPVQNSYGGSAFVRYILPEVKGAKSDFTVGYSNGDYGVGYMGMNRDGVNRVYGFWRTNAEVYAELGVRY
jgi:hypothetical protein